jgi:serine/threonine-protein kinase
VKPDETPVHASPPKASFGDLLAELKRRRVFRVMVGYGIFAFAVLQVIEPIMHGMSLPDWVLKAVLVALAVGFPVALILAWLFDLTAQGVIRTPTTSGVRGTYFSKGRLAALLVVIGLLGALPGIGWYFWKQAGERGLGKAPGATPSIAVLPFDDLSPGHDQDYFSDGVAGEILNALSRVEGLRVPGRASSFWFKGKQASPPEIAQKLGVTHLLEGNVRRSGNKVRVDAEVILAGDGARIWAQTFEREQADIFAIQDEIASAVVVALKVKLLPGTSPPNTGARTSNLAAYEQYLLGRQLGGAGRPDTIPAARDAFKRAVDLDPRFAAAYAGLSHAWGHMAGYVAQGPEDVVRYAGLQREAAERALALEPNSPDGLIARADYRLGFAWDWSGALADAERVTSLSGADWLAHTTRARALAALGRLDDALASARRATEVDPLAPGAWTNLAVILDALGDAPGAERAARQGLVVAPGNDITSFGLGLALFQQGRYEEAAAKFDQNTFEWWRLQGRAIALHKLGREPESRAALEALESGYAGFAAFQIAETHAVRGGNDAAFQWLERARLQHDAGLEGVRNDRLLASLHRDPRWKPFLRMMNLPVD